MYMHKPLYWYMYDIYIIKFFKHLYMCIKPFQSKKLQFNKIFPRTQFSASSEFATIFYLILNYNFFHNKYFVELLQFIHVCV